MRGGTGTIMIDLIERASCAWAVGLLAVALVIGCAP